MQACVIAGFLFLEWKRDRDGFVAFTGIFTDLLAEYAVCGLIVSNYYTRYCSGVKRIPEHTPVVTFVSCRVDSVMLDTDRDSQESDFAVSLGYVVVIFVIFRR